MALKREAEQRLFVATVRALSGDEREVYPDLGRRPEEDARPAHNACLLTHGTSVTSVR